MLKCTHAFTCAVFVGINNISSEEMNCGYFKTSSHIFSSHNFVLKISDLSIYRKYEQNLCLLLYLLSWFFSKYCRLYCGSELQCSIILQSDILGLNVLSSFSTWFLLRLHGKYLRHCCTALMLESWKRGPTRKALEDQMKLMIWTHGLDINELWVISGNHLHYRHVLQLSSCAFCFPDGNYQDFTHVQ